MMPVKRSYSFVNTIISNDWVSIKFWHQTVLKHKDNIIFETKAFFSGIDFSEKVNSKEFD